MGERLAPESLIYQLAQQSILNFDLDVGGHKIHDNYIYELFVSPKAFTTLTKLIRPKPILPHSTDKGTFHEFAHEGWAITTLEGMDEPRPPSPKLTKPSSLLSELAHYGITNNYDINAGGRKTENGWANEVYIRYDKPFNRLAQATDAKTTHIKLGDHSRIEFPYRGWTIFTLQESVRSETQRLSL